MFCLKCEYQYEREAWLLQVCDLTVDMVITGYNKGSTYYGEISGTSSNLYPQNGGDDKGYYVYIGIK